MDPFLFIVIMKVLLGVIMGEYIVIAVQFGYQAYQMHGENKAGVNSLLYLVAIFLLCMVCGYGLRAIQPSVLIEMCLYSPVPPLVIVLMHLSLAVASGLYVLTNQAGIVLTAMRIKRELG